MLNAIAAAADLRSTLALEGARIVLIWGCALALIAAGPALPGLGL